MTLAGITFVLCMLLQDNDGLEYIFNETHKLMHCMVQGSAGEEIPCYTEPEGSPLC
jgi:hypothetical protein